MTAGRHLAAAIMVAAIAAGLLSGQSPDFDRARQLLTSGHPEEAAAIYRELSRKDPGNPGMLLNLSIAEYKAGKFRDAAASAAGALTLDPNLVAAHLFLGASCLELGELEKAVDSLGRVVRANPGERNARLMLGEALLRRGRAAEAVEHLQSVAEALPANPRVWFALGGAYEMLGQKESAERAWGRLADLPPSLESHMHSAQVNDAGRRWREAASEWREALKLSPRNAAVRLGLAWSLFRSRDYDGALSELDPLIGAAANADVQFVYGASLLNLQKPVDAIPHLRAALARNPQLVSARAALGQALLQTGNLDEAIPMLEQALPADEDGSTHFQLFRAYQLAHRMEDAQRALVDYKKMRASAEGAR